MIQAIFIVFGGIFLSWFMGYPLTYYAFNKKSKYLSADALNALSVFVGFALIVSIQLVLVGIDIPVMYTAYPILILSIILFIIMMKRGIIKLILPSKLFFIGIVLIIMISGFSLFIDGVHYYKGYTWWDTLYYGSHAEFIKTTPFSHLDALVFDQPYLGSSYHYFHGAHRIGRGVYQAFIASLFLVDGASTIGYMNVFGTILTYFGVIYLCDGFGFKRQQTLLVAFAATIVPNVVITQLEGFIPIGLFSAFTLVIVRIFLDQFRLKTVRLAILSGILVTSFITTLLDGTLMVIGMFILSFLIALFTKELKLKKLPLMFLTPLVVFILVFSYRSQFALELSNSVLRSSLNYIYIFAYSPQGLNWIFWGHTLLQSSVPNNLYLVMTFLSIAFFIASYVGIFLIMYKLKRGEGLTMLAMALMPFIFWSMKNNTEALDLRYSLFKVMTFAVPIIIVGLFYFFDVVLQWIKDTWSDESNPGYKKLYIAMHHFLQFCVYSLILVFMISSIERVSLPLRTDEIRKIGIRDRVANMLRFNDSEARSLYERLSGSGKDFLLVSNDVDLGFWWSVYYGRNNNLYTLTNRTYKTYIENQHEVELATIPNTVEIVYTPDNSIDAMVDIYDQNDVALVVKTIREESSNIYIKRTAIFEADIFSFLVYSKSAHVATVSMNIELLGDEPVSIKTDEGNIVVDKSGVYEFELNIVEGAQEIMYHFSGDSALKISNVAYSK